MHYTDLDCKNKNILLLQGPMGNYFKRFKKILEALGASSVKQISFNAGDWLYSNKRVNTNYRGTFENWAMFLKTFIIAKKIQQIYLLGGDRKYHHQAKIIANELNIKIFVFEEGYIRPGWITLEENGVNGNSNLIKKYNPNVIYKKIVPRKDIENMVGLMSRNAIIYALMKNIGNKYFPNYEHHKSLNLYTRFVYGVKNIFLKIIHKKLDEKKLYPFMLSQKKFFIIPLQVHDDFQVITHSRYKNIEEFIYEAIKSFSKSDNKTDSLIFKHHPMDRGIKNYSKYVLKISSKFGVKERVICIYEAHLPTLLKKSRGCLTINSTVGLSSLFHGNPTKIMGKAMYKLSGSHFSGSLKDFWIRPSMKNHSNFLNFYNFIKIESQINDSFHIKG